MTQLHVKGPTILRLRGGGGDFEKKYPASACAKEKNSCTRPSCQKKLMHVQWAEKKKHSGKMFPKLTH